MRHGTYLRSIDDMNLLVSEDRAIIFERLGITVYTVPRQGRLADETSQATVRHGRCSGLPTSICECEWPNCYTS